MLRSRRVEKGVDLAFDFGHFGEDQPLSSAIAAGSPLGTFSPLSRQPIWLYLRIKFFNSAGIGIVNNLNLPRVGAIPPMAANTATAVASLWFLDRFCSAGTVSISRSTPPNPARTSLERQSRAMVYRRSPHHSRAAREQHDQPMPSARRSDRAAGDRSCGNPRYSI